MVCVCVCVRERERGGVRRGVRVFVGGWVGVAMLSRCTTVQDPDLRETGTRKVILLPVTDLTNCYSS